LKHAAEVASLKDTIATLNEQLKVSAGTVARQAMQLSDAEQNSRALSARLQHVSGQLVEANRAFHVCLESTEVCA
jgi:hypothetical protein